MENSALAPFDCVARFYDMDYREYDGDLQLVADLAQESEGPLLELGSGTGRVLLPMAGVGHRVTGVDFSPALLARAREKLASAPFADQVTLVQADLRTFALPEQDFGLAYCVSNTLMHLTTQEEQLAVLENAHRHLRPGGRLLLDLFNPDVPEFLRVAGLQELADRWHDPATGAQVLKWSIRWPDLARQLLETTFIYKELFPDGRSQRTVCPFTLRFLWPSEGVLMLRLVGFQVEAVWGDFDGHPHTAESERLIFLAHKA